MKSHTAAKTLEEIARLLRAGPNSEISSLKLSAESDKKMSSQAIAVNLVTLSQLAKINKTQWIEFIRKNKIPIEVRPRDASRDIIGRLLKFVDEHPDALKLLRHAADHDRASSQMTSALRFLMDG